MTEPCRLSSIGAGNRLRHLGRLRASTDDTLTIRGVHVGDVLVLKLSTLPDLHLAATTEDTNTHSREEVVGGVGVVVDTTVKDGGGILADGRVDEGTATRVVLDEVGDIVDDTGNSNEALSFLRLSNEVIPVNNGELVKRNTPVKGSTLLVKLLLKLLDAALLDLVGAELLQLVGKTKLLPQPDGPLGGVVLPPLDSVAVVGRELMVEVVITLAESDKGGDDVVTRRVSVVERLLTDPVGKRIDAEGSLLDDEDTKDTSINETTDPITPAETSNESREDEAHTDDTLEEVLVLPDDNGVLVQIGDVSATHALGVLLEDHPAKVRVPETLADGVGILLSIGVAVMDAMAE